MNKLIFLTLVVSLNVFAGGKEIIEAGQEILFSQNEPFFQFPVVGNNPIRMHVLEGEILKATLDKNNKVQYDFIMESVPGLSGHILHTSDDKLFNDKRNFFSRNKNICASYKGKEFCNSGIVKHVEIVGIQAAPGKSSSRKLLVVNKERNISEFVTLKDIYYFSKD